MLGLSKNAAQGDAWYQPSLCVHLATHSPRAFFMKQLLLGRRVEQAAKDKEGYAGPQAANSVTVKKMPTAKVWGYKA